MTTNPSNYFIRLDNREKELIKNKAKLGFPVKTEQLVVGDIQFWDGNNILICIERKTYADLSASIKTGRYREQKHRLLKSYPKKVITYLLEIDIDLSKMRKSMALLEILFVSTFFEFTI